MSLSLSKRTAFAGNRAPPVEVSTSRRSVPATTWALVITRSGETTKPLPSRA